MRAAGLVVAVALLAAGLAGGATAAPGLSDTPATRLQEPETVVSPLVVTGRLPHLSRPEMARAVERFLLTHGAETRVERLARWRGRVCIETLGLDDALNAEVTRRIAAVGTTIGAPPTEAPGCRANIEVVFTAAPQAFIDRVADHDWILLGFHYASQTQRITRFEHPIQAWYVTGSRGGATAAAGVAGTLADQTTGTRQLIIDDPFGQSAPYGTATRIPDGPRSELANVLVIVDQSRVAGQSTEAIADYVAVLAYSQVKDADACTPLPSILDLLATCTPPRAPTGLTPSDVAYLKALYTLDTGLPIHMTRAEIGQAMTRALRR